MGKAISKYDQIVTLLTKKPHLRQNLPKVIANMWHTEMINLGMDPKNISGFDVLGLVANGSLTPSSTIRRTWQLVQEQNPHLAGKHRKDKKLEREAKQEIMRAKMRTV